MSCFQLGEFELTLDRPFEATLCVTNLADGAMVDGEPFAVADPRLGHYELEPGETLADVCGEGTPLYTCTVIEGPDGEAWDPENCMAWPPPPPVPATATPTAAVARRIRPRARCEDSASSSSA